MTLSRRLVISRFAGTLSFLTFNRAAFAGTVVKVALWDKGEGSMDGVDTMMPMGMAISPVPDPSMELPYLIDSMMVDDAAAGTTARVKELRPRDSGSVTVDLQPGTYILYCNMAGHYVTGMWTIITVTE